MSNKAGADLPIVGNYQLVKKLGKGAYGTVKLGVHVKTGEKVHSVVSFILVVIQLVFHSQIHSSVSSGSCEGHQIKTHQNAKRKTNG
jgi:serine/threonine protein kinase